MSRLETVFIHSAETDLFGRAATIRATDSVPRRPANVEITQGGATLRLPSFAPRMLNQESSTLQPYVEVAELGGIGLVQGVRTLVLVDPESGLDPHVVPLNRTSNDDPGWYRTDAFELCDQGVLVVYEGGLIFVSRGFLRWHRHKSWNDVLVGFDSAGIRLMNAEDEAYTVDVASGGLASEA